MGRTGSDIHLGQPQSEDHSNVPMNVTDSVVLDFRTVENGSLTFGIGDHYKKFSFCRRCTCEFEIRVMVLFQTKN